MKVSTLTRWLPAAVLAAGIAIPAAQAGRPASVQLDPAISAALRSLPATVAFDGASPDRLDAYYAAQASRATEFSSPGSSDARLFANAPPDRLDAYRATQASQVTGSNGRLFTDAPPDRLDAYRATQLGATPVVNVTSGGFDWSDAGIGFAGAVGLALLALAGGIAIRRNVKTGRAMHDLPV